MDNLSSTQTLSRNAIQSSSSSATFPVTTLPMVPMPKIQPANLVRVERRGDIQGTWAIDSSLKVPREALRLSNEPWNETALKRRPSIRLTSENGRIEAMIYIVPTLLVFGRKTATIYASCKDEDITLALVDAEKSSKGLKARFLNRPPLVICCEAAGNVAIALPRSFRGAVRLACGTMSTYLRQGRFGWEYSAAVKEQLSVTTSDETECRGFIGSSIKGGKDRLDVECYGRILVCYDDEVVETTSSEVVDLHAVTAR